MIAVQMKKNVWVKLRAMFMASVGFRKLSTETLAVKDVKESKKCSWFCTMSGQLRLYIVSKEINGWGLGGGGIPF